MYHENGDFGLVRMVTLLPTPQSRSLFSLHTIGWHRCNDLYRITRPNGCETHLVLITTKGRGVLLQNGPESLAEIADRLGYCSPSSFIRAFKRAYGMTPHAYRRTHFPLTGHTAE